MNNKIIIVLLGCLLFSCGGTNITSTSSSSNSSYNNHNGPSSYEDPQAVDLTKVELPNHNFEEKFYQPESWIAMTNNNGESNDHFNIPLLDEGKLTFNNTNGAIDIGDYSNKTMSFMINGNNDYNLYVRAKTIDNQVNDYLKIECNYRVLRIKTSFSGNSAVAYVPAGYNYLVGEWNRIDLSFSLENNKTTMKLWLNNVPVKMKKATDFSKNGVQIKEGNLVLEENESFHLGNYFIVKIWDDNDYVSIKAIGV